MRRKAKWTKAMRAAAAARMRARMADPAYRAKVGRKRKATTNHIKPIKGQTTKIGKVSPNVISREELIGLIDSLLREMAAREVLGVFSLVAGVAARASSADRAVGRSLSS